MSRAPSRGRTKQPASEPSAAFPDGLADRHADDSGRINRHANILSLLVLGALLGAALLGLFGGGKSQPLQAGSPDAVLTVTTPRTLRSGIFFETRITVAARRALTDVVIALPPQLWRDQTINTTIPNADKEAGEDGSFRFHYGPLAAGKTLEIKYDGQLNPPLFAGTKGSIALLDGDRALTTIPLTYRVWP